MRRKHIARWAWLFYRCCCRQPLASRRYVRVFRFCVFKTTGQRRQVFGCVSISSTAARCFCVCAQAVFITSVRCLKSSPPTTCKAVFRPRRVGFRYRLAALKVGTTRIVFRSVFCLFCRRRRGPKCRICRWETRVSLVRGHSHDHTKKLERCSSHLAALPCINGVVNLQKTLASD